MKFTNYLTVEEILKIHNKLLQRFGGIEGVRDLGLLESTVMRPRSAYYKSLSAQAGAIFHSLCLNHCFNDGNKRVAFVSTDIFLRMNGYKLNVPAEIAENFIVNEIIINKVSLEEIIIWLEKYMAKV